jgi:cbb3-type cytochrome oxidase subunit 3
MASSSFSLWFAPPLALVLWWVWRRVTKGRRDRLGRKWLTERVKVMDMKKELEG